MANSNLIGQIAQQMQELENQLATAHSQNERLRVELATKDAEIARVNMPRLTKLRSEGDPGYVDMDNVKTVRQRLSDRDIILRELKDLVRRKPSRLVGEKLRKHEWKMTGIANLPPVSLWQEEELAREAKHDIRDKTVEEERSPPISPRYPVMTRKHMATTVEKRIRNRPGCDPPRELIGTPQSSPRCLRQHETGRCHKPAPRQDTVMRSVEAPPPLSGHGGLSKRESHILAPRKPVCKHCWDSRQWCDSLSLCTNCKASGDKCVYMQCRSVQVCGNPRCLYIHSDQWKEQDSTWHVEHGTLRYKYPIDPRRRMSQCKVEDTLDARDGQPPGVSVKKRCRSPEGSDGLGEGFVRKSVCMHCYDTNTLCDFNGRCNPCRDANLKCVRIHCKQGLACRAKKCPCVHPGQYDPKDTAWNVEHGVL